MSWTLVYWIPWICRSDEDWIKIKSNGLIRCKSYSWTLASWTLVSRIPWLFLSDLKALTNYSFNILPRYLEHWYLEYHGYVNVSWKFQLTIISIILPLYLNVFSLLHGVQDNEVWLYKDTCIYVYQCGISVVLEYYSKQNAM